MVIHLTCIFHYSFFFICEHLGYQILVKIYNVNFVFVYLRELCVAQDGFKLATQSRLALNFWFSLFLPPKC